MKEGSGLKKNKKFLWDYFRTCRADQRVKCETAQRARFGYTHDVSLGKERLQGPRSAMLSAPTPNTLSSSPLPFPTWKNWQPQSWWNCPTMAHAYTLRNAWQSLSLCWREKKQLWTDPSSTLEVDREGSSEESHLQERSWSRWQVYAGDFMFAKPSAALFATGSFVRCWQFSDLKASRNITARYNTHDSQEKDSSGAQ